MSRSWRLKWMVAGLWLFLSAQDCFADCCLCDCTPADVCLNVPAADCTDACGNQNPACGFISFSADQICTPLGCVDPQANTVPAATQPGRMWLAATLLGIGAWSLRRLARRRAS